jgi:CheY-like chemotaxis protein
VGNAVKFTQTGHVILRVRVQDEGHAPPSATLIPPSAICHPQSTVLIEIEDSGIGIPAEDQQRIFDPFIQLNGQSDHKGTGLGLAISRQQVELMGGRITVQSTPGKGSLFRVEIPVARIDASEVAAAKTDLGRVLGLAPGQPAYRMLIVEDQVENWLLLQRMLEGVGFQVRVAENGVAGIELFQAWHPHFIWMDIRMPGMDGLEVTRRIRALDGGCDVKIAALTASALKEERDNVTVAGMDDVIYKPYRPQEIYDCLARHLGVRFVYDGTPAPMAAEAAGPLRLEALAALPLELRGELAGALISLDAGRIGEIIRRISGQNPALGGLLAHHAAQLEYSAILQVVKQDRRKMPS